MNVCVCLSMYPCAASMSATSFPIYNLPPEAFSCPPPLKYSLAHALAEYPLLERMDTRILSLSSLSNAVIDRPNQAWSIDITYIPIKRGFLYLTAVIDWYSRCIVGWEVDDTLDTRMVINALKKAFKVAKPQILNSDQGCQFTSQQYIDFVKENGIRQSMDGKSRWADNIMIERWFRSFKYEEAYLTQYNNIKEARAAIGQYIHTYNFERRHSALDYQTPAECYYPAMLMPYVA